MASSAERKRRLLATGRAVLGRAPNAGGSRATLSIEYSALGPVVAWLTRGINEPDLAMEAEGLERRSERVT